MLDQDGYESWPKLTGGKGVHLMVPIERGMSHDKARAYCRALPERLAATSPECHTLIADPKARTGRIYVDYLRNGRGNTAVGAYSPRARAGFPAAAPVTWRDIEQGITPDAFSKSRPPRR